QTDGCEVQTGGSDVANCGGCAVVCSTNHITPTCTTGGCNGAGAAGYSDCNANKQTDGCEVQTSGTDVDNCGGCGVVCSANHIPTPTCGGGVCNGGCAAGYSDCNANKQTDGCETQINGSDVNNCGGCGIICLAGQVCCNG